MRGRGPGLHVLIAAALLLAGCVGSPGTEEPEPASTPEPRPAIELDEIQTPASCEFSCYEPTVAAGPEGTLYVTHGSPDAEIAVSEDRGAPWETHQAPPIPPRERPTADRGDETVHVGPGGDLWYTALLFERVWTGAAFVMHGTGVQVAVSPDGGETWSSNQALAPREPPTWGADRQWLAFGEDGTAYLSAKAMALTAAYTPAGSASAVGAAPTDLWVTRTDDGGETWTDWQQATHTGPSYGLIGGPPIATGDQELVVPYFYGGLHVTRSGDGGQTWEQTTVWKADGEAGNMFPIAAQDEQGALHLLWKGPDGAVRHAQSTDDAGSWTEPSVLDPERPTPTSPWIEAGPGNITVSWFHETEDGVALRHGQLGLDDNGTAELANATRVAQTPAYNDRDPAATDFAHAARLPDGEIVHVWNDPDEGVLHTRIAS